MSPVRCCLRFNQPSKPPGPPVGRCLFLTSRSTTTRHEKNSPVSSRPVFSNSVHFTRRCQTCPATKICWRYALKTSQQQHTQCKLHPSKCLPEVPGSTLPACSRWSSGITAFRHAERSTRVRVLRVFGRSGTVQRASTLKFPDNHNRIDPQHPKRIVQDTVHLTNISWLVSNQT